MEPKCLLHENLLHSKHVNISLKLSRFWCFLILRLSFLSLPPSSPEGFFNTLQPSVAPISSCPIGTLLPLQFDSGCESYGWKRKSQKLYELDWPFFFPPGVLLRPAFFADSTLSASSSAAFSDNLRFLACLTF